MGRQTAEKPKFLSVKLTQARTFLGFTQEKMYEALKRNGSNLHLGYISLFETGQRTPSFLILLAYAKISGITMEMFVDDDLELTEEYFKKVSAGISK